MSRGLRLGSSAPGAAGGLGSGGPSFRNFRKDSIAMPTKTFLGAVSYKGFCELYLVNISFNFVASMSENLVDSLSMLHIGKISLCA
jgi:hypothetical protein